MSLESPFSVLFDAEGVELAVSESQAITSTQPGLVVFGSGSTGFEYLRLSDNGELFVTGAVAANLAPNTPVSQGNPGALVDAWNIKITDGTQVLGTGSSAPIFVTGSVQAFLAGDTQVAVSGLNFDGPNLLTELSGVDVFGGHLNVTGTVNAVISGQPIQVSGTVQSREAPCTTSVVSGVGASTSNFTVLSANEGRCKATFFMDGNASAYIKLGAGANPTGSYSVRVLNNGYFETPSNYTGQIDVVFDKDDSSKILRVTEISD